MEPHITDMLFGAADIAAAPVLCGSFTVITGKLPPAHWLTTRTQTLSSSSDYLRGRNAKLAGLPYDPTRTLDWRMGWLETHPELNIDPEIPEDWERQLQSYRNGAQAANDPERATANEGEVKLKLDLSPVQATALANFLRRAGIEEVRGSASGDAEADSMRDAIIALADALAEARHSPR